MAFHKEGDGNPGSHQMGKLPQSGHREMANEGETWSD